MGDQDDLSLTRQSSVSVIIITAYKLAIAVL